MSYKEIYEKNIFIQSYEIETIDKDAIDQIKFHEDKAKELRKELGLYTYIYAPATHSIFLERLIRNGRRLLWKEFEPPIGKKSGTRKYGIVEKFEPVSSQQMEIEVGETVLDRIDYKKEQYMKITVITERDETIAMITGKSKYLFL